MQSYIKVKQLLVSWQKVKYKWIINVSFWVWVIALSGNFLPAMFVLFTLTLLALCKISISGMQISPNCSQPLGMEDGRISDSQISASSSYQHTLVGPAKESRLYAKQYKLTWNELRSTNCYNLFKHLMVLGWFSRSALLRREDLLNVARLFVCGSVCIWLLQVTWNKNYWWHHSTLSTSIVKSVKASMASTQNSQSAFWKLYLILINSLASTIIGFNPEFTKSALKIIPDFDQLTSSNYKNHWLWFTLLQFFMVTIKV